MAVTSCRYFPSSPCQCGAVVSSPRLAMRRCCEQRIATIAGMQNVVNGKGAAVGVDGFIIRLGMTKHAVEMLDRFA